MEHKYILLKDSDGYENLWEIIHEINGVYAISRCETMSVVLKDTCFNKGGSILYSNVVRDFESIPYVEDDESYLRYLNKNNFEPDYLDKEWVDCCNDSMGGSFIDMDDNGNIYEILSLDYLKELEYNMCDKEYKEWVNGEDKL